MVTRARDDVVEHSMRVVEQASSEIRSSVQFVMGMGPGRTLQRGFVMAKRMDGKVVMRSDTIASGDTLTLSFADGDVAAKVNQVTKKEIT